MLAPGLLGSIVVYLRMKYANVCYILDMAKVHNSEANLVSIPLGCIILHMDGKKRNIYYQSYHLINPYLQGNQARESMFLLVTVKSNITNLTK